MTSRMVLGRSSGKASLGLSLRSTSTLRPACCAVTRSPHQARWQGSQAGDKESEARGPNAQANRRHKHLHQSREGRFEKLKSDPNVQAMRKVDMSNFKTSDQFRYRHIGPRDEDVEAMLSKVGGNAGLDDFINQVVPKELQHPPENIFEPGSHMKESTLASVWERLTKMNKNMHWMNGEGFYPVTTPAVIKRNILENPAWYTSYTPYQAEISQGRLESLLNFQTMVSDLTGLPVANSSLLDEGTAAAEAMTMSLNCLPSSRQKGQNKTFVVSHRLFRSTFKVLHGRAEGWGINVVQMDLDSPESLDKLRELGNDLIGVMLQYPGRYGVNDYSEVTKVAHELGVQVSAATDLSALTMLKPPGEWGADIAFGNSQRFGIPLGFGGPHAAFFATKESNKRRLPGRIIGVTKDRLGRPAMRLALQTREQHIRREKATSNVCTAQALLANMAAMYAIYHGPDALKSYAITNVRKARAVEAVAKELGYEIAGSSSFPDTPTLSDTVSLGGLDRMQVTKLVGAMQNEGISIHGNNSEQMVSLSISEDFDGRTFAAVVKCLASAAPNSHPALESESGRDEHIGGLSAKHWQQAHEASDEAILESIPGAVKRESSFMTHPVFNTHHSETEILRYMHHLQSRDLSQVHSMIPLGSCTMKLNGTTELALISDPKHANVHPLAVRAYREGYDSLTSSLQKQLAKITGFAATSLQPNSGAQGEFAGLRVIRKYHQSLDAGSKRDICLIPISAHGTNPASAAMAGMRTVPIKCDNATGNLDIADLKQKCEKHAHELAAVMITYPSTYGVFEPDVKKAIDLVHEHGGMVYMDGANMNAQIGLTSPGALGADVCHLNLHKTFCIPHGGGGPGVGPICVNEKLKPFLPNNSDMVASSLFGSASILPISWAYIMLMRDEGLVKATKVALLNANYLLARLKEHYSIVYTNDAGRCAHEFILDLRPLEKSAGVNVADVAKRLQDYGFHSPTMSWPVPGTLMIEPTESESKEELDRFADALISIREEIREIEEGKQPREGNVLKNAPHPQLDLIRGDGDGKWERPYSREKAAYPLPYLIEKKFWPTVARADDGE